VHSAFNAGITIPDVGGCFSVAAQSLLAKEWRSINVLIIDEVICLHKRFIDAISHTFHHNIFVDDADRRNMGPFCGVTVIVSGDPRQQLPISPGANRQTLSSIGFHSSELFNLFEKFHLTENVRIHPSVIIHHVDGTDQSLQRWILNVGDGVRQVNDVDVDGRSFVSIPPQFYCGDQVDELIGHIYCKDEAGMLSARSDYFAARVILTPLYKDVQMINIKMLEQYKNEGHAISHVKSHDTITGKFGDVEDANQYSASLFPEHSLSLFIGCPVMCLRKYNDLLSNGDRAVVESISTYRLGLRLLTGRSVGKVVHLPRMLFTPSSKSLKIQMNRLQFGVVVAFAITVSKSQSCGFNNVGVWLNDHFFAHGHLYLALSRLHVKQDGIFKLMFASRQNIMLDDRGVFALNTVYNEVLSSYK
jgi:ATP-dependent DNA helicase PIF1